MIVGFPPPYLAGAPLGDDGVLDDRLVGALSAGFFADWDRRPLVPCKARGGISPTE